jgi:hypothetical protein
MQALAASCEELRARTGNPPLDFASAFLSPGLNSRAELVHSPRAYARNGALRRLLGDKTTREIPKDFIRSKTKDIVPVRTMIHDLYKIVKYQLRNKMH